jgi:isoquinoline 1-oxidoreductase beta subunit
MSKSNMNPAITRRNFIASASAAAGSLVLSFHVPFAQAQEAKPEINAWVVVKPDDSVVIRIARAEMGQGTLTGLAQMVAEELECNWAKVSTEHPTPGQSLARKRVWGNFNATGSRGIRESNDYVRKGGAAARMMLVQAAAEAWGVPAAECVAANSIITHKASGRKTSYGKVAEAAARITPPEAASIVLKDPKNWRLIGKRMARLDTAGKTTGAQNYGVDFKLPGLLNAAIRDCPVFGGTVKSFNAAAVEGRPGVRQVVQVGTSAVAVVADTWWRAKAAVEALPIDWDLGPNSQVSSNSIREILKAGLDAKEAVVGSSKGDAPAVLASASRKIEAVYSYPLLSHAPLEPMNATARWTPERCEVWAPTQNAEATLAATVEASGLAATKCDVYQHPGSADCQSLARHTHQTDLVAGRRHDTWLFPSGDPMQTFSCAG